jgi:hypothetical protein
VKRTVQKIAREKALQAKSKTREAAHTKRVAKLLPKGAAPGKAGGKKAKAGRSSAIQKTTRKLRSRARYKKALK